MPGRAGAAVATFQINEPWYGKEEPPDTGESSSQRRRRIKRQASAASRGSKKSDPEAPVGDLDESEAVRDSDSEDQHGTSGRRMGSDSEASNKSKSSPPTKAKGSNPSTPPTSEGNIAGGHTPRRGASPRFQNADAGGRAAAADSAAGPASAAQPSENQVEVRVDTQLEEGQQRPVPHSEMSRQSVSSKAESALFSDSDQSSVLFAEERRRVRKLMVSPRFDALIGIVIVSNCVTIGVEQSQDLRGQDTTVVKTLEHIYLVIYTMELLFRFFGFRLTCLLDNWVKFDLFLVVIGILTGWILPPILGKVDQLGPLMVLRTARLMRLARTVRLLIKFRELWMLVRGLLNSASTMIYTLLMLFIIIYIFSCMAIEIIANHRLATKDGPDFDPEFRAFVDENFGSLPLTMLTLMQFASLDNMNLIYMPLVKKSWWLAGFFIIIILVVSIVLMNLITAVVVNSALEQAMSDKEAMKAQENKRRKKLMKDLKLMFQRLDDDNSGQVSADEMQQMGEEDKNLLYNVLGVSDPLEVFKQLDVDGSGLLEIDEFCDGIWQVAISKAPIELKRIEKQVNSLKNAVNDFKEMQGSMQEILDTVLYTINKQGAATARTKDSAREEEQREQKEPKFNSNPGLEGSPQMPLKSGSASTLQSCPEILDLDDFRELPKSMSSWRKDIDFRLDGLKSSVTLELQELSNQMQQALVSAQQSGNAKKQRIVSLGDWDGEKAVETSATENAPFWAELRSELLEAAQSIKAGVHQTAALPQRAVPVEELQLAPKQPPPAKPTRSQWPVFGGMWNQSSTESVATPRGAAREAARDAFALGETPPPALLAARPAWVEELREAILQEIRSVGEEVRSRSTSEALVASSTARPTWASDIVHDLQRIFLCLELKKSRTASSTSEAKASPKAQ